MSRRATKAQLEHRREIHAAAIAAGEEFGRIFGRGGARPGAGAKPLHGKAMRKRSIRWDDEGWADACRIGHERVRELVKAEAAAIRNLASHGIVKGKA